MNVEEYRDYRVVLDKFSMYRIMNMGKGAIPKVLTGTYTSPKFAKSAIDGYLASKSS